MVSWSIVVPWCLFLGHQVGNQCLELMENLLFVGVGPWYTEQHSLHLIAEEGPRHPYTSLQKLQEILYSWACQARSSTAKVTLWHVPVIGSLWSCGCKELFYVLWNKKKCQTTQFCDNVIARLIGTCISKGHRENLHLPVGRVSQNDFVPVSYYVCVTHI